MESSAHKPSPGGPSDQSEADGLENRSDEELRTLAGRITKILTAREDKRKKEALAQIREIAQRHGLAVNVEQPKRKRGRPRKAPATS